MACKRTIVEKNIVDLELGEEISIIGKNWESRGGGVAILFSKARCKLKEYKMCGNPGEVVAALGKFKGDSRKLLLVCAYLPPKTTAHRLGSILESVSDTITKAKTENGDLYLVLGGDLNRFCITVAIDQFPNMQEVDSPSTQDGARLDMMYTNFNDLITEVTLRQPLTTLDDVPSDHGVLLTTAELKHCHRFKINKTTTRPITPEGKLGFVSDLSRVDWCCIKADDLTTATTIFNSVLTSLIERHFPQKTTKWKSTDDLWISKGVRKKIEQ